MASATAVEGGEEIVVDSLDLWRAIQVQSEFRRGNRVGARNEMSNVKRGKRSGWRRGGMEYGE